MQEGIKMNALTTDERDKGYRLLFDGETLEGWSVTNHAESWVIDDQSIHCTAAQNSGYLYTFEQFENFALSIDFKTEPEVNSGIFFRWSDLNDPVNTGLEMQILDTYGKETLGNHDCGALYDLVAPRQRAERPAGEWNHALIECRGSRIVIKLNDILVIDVDLDRWDTPGENPDGSPNKFKYAWREMPRKGRIGLQNHGGRVWFRNIKIRSFT